MIILLLAGSELPAQNPYIQHFTTQDGLPSNTVYYIYQDSKKFIWFATDAGVSRYDGTSFVNFRKKDGLSSNEVIKIKEDSFGRIWFFNYNTAMDFFYHEKIYNAQNTPFLKAFEGEDYFIDFYQDPNLSVNFFNKRNSIFVLNTENKVSRFIVERKRWLEFLKKNPFRDGVSKFLSKEANDTFIVWTESGIVRFNARTQKYSVVCDTIKINGVFPSGDESYYIATSDHTILFIVHGTVMKSFQFPYKFPLTQEKIKSVMRDHDMGIWVVTFDEGVFYRSGEGNIQHFDIKEGQSVIQDHENNIWISSMREGVFMISPFLFSHKHYESGLFQDLGILAMGNAVDKGVWLTNGKSIFLLKNNIQYTLMLKNEMYAFNSVYQVNNTSLLVGEKSFYFNLINGIRLEEANRQLHFNSISNVRVHFKQFNFNNNRTEMCSYTGSSAFVFNLDKMFADFNEIFVGERVYNAFYDVHNDLVINARKNYIYRNRNLLPYPELSRFENKIITDHLTLNDSTELYNVEGDSIYLFNKNTFYNLSDAFGVPIDLQIRSIIYHKPKLFLGTSGNVYWCDNPMNVIPYKKVKLHLLDINFRNIHDLLLSNDSLYVASDDGLTVIPEALIGKGTAHIPIPYIRTAFINDQEFSPGDSGFSGRGNTKIAFSFGCIHYSSTPVLYAYKLQGLDTAWTAVTASNVVYQRLLSGNYTFMLKVRKSTSEWSEVVEYPVQIKASIWQHPLFFVFLAIIALVVIALFIIRRKNLQMKHRELDHHLVTLELKALQSMMNPHFIFNALGSIQNFLFQNKNDEAGLYLSQFARLIRQNMNALNEAMINLDEEVDRLKNYLDLERLRMENKFDYRIEPDEHFEPEDIRIPSMIIQPFVENSIWHGISTLDGKGLICITFARQDENMLKVIIEDNGIGIKKAQATQSKDGKHLKLGMEMTRKRLELLGRKYNVKTCVEFSDIHSGSANPGTRVLLIIPFSDTASRE
jgi:two-component sensor histidine kinase